MSEKNFIYSILNDYYKSILKDNQALIIDLYYNQDYSLSEIASELGISRQGIHDALKRAEKNLLEYEEKMKLHSKFDQYYKSAEKIVELLEKITETKYKDVVQEIKNEATKILNEG